MYSLTCRELGAIQREMVWSFEVVKTRVQREETQMGVSRASGTAALRSKEQECSEVRCMECDPHFGYCSYMQAYCQPKSIRLCRQSIS